MKHDRDRDPYRDYNYDSLGYYFGILFWGGRPARPAGRLGPNSRPERPILAKTDKFSTETPNIKIPVGGGHITLSVRNTQHSPLSATQLLWWNHSTLCLRHSIPLVGPQHSPLFATQNSSGRITALSSVCDTAFLRSVQRTLLRSRQHIPLVGRLHIPLVATTRSSGGTTAFSSDRNSRLLYWQHNTFLCWYKRRRRRGL